VQVGPGLGGGEFRGRVAGLVTIAGQVGTLFAVGGRFLLERGDLGGQFAGGRRGGGGDLVLVLGLAGQVAQCVQPADLGDVLLGFGAEFGGGGVGGGFG